MMLEQALKHHFQLTSFRPGQKEVISSVLEGNHTIAMLPTGTGKSLCYQLAGYMLSGHVIIISPLLSLMQDQAEQMVMNGEKRVIAFNSFLTREEKAEAITNLEKYKFIFLSPEMLRLEGITKRLMELDISLFVIDEAHCISQWGYDFRPDYLKLGEVREQLGSPLTLVLTATATPEAKEDIIRSLHLSEWKEFIYSVDRPNISLTVEKLHSQKDKIERLVHLVKSLQGPGIIYFSSKKLSEQMAHHLKEKGIGRVMAYHGGMEQESRILIQQQFLNGQLDLICATSAFGMGINKENIRYVIHFHMPLQLESYLQEIGRAGRDGKKSIAILLYCLGDEQLAFQIAEGELPDQAQLDRIHSFFKEYPLSDKLSEYENQIRSFAGLTETQWRMIEGYIEEMGPDHFDELAVFVKNRSEIKKNKIFDMYKWIQSDQCRRSNILSYFKEVMNKVQADCCDCCGIDITQFFISENNEAFLHHSYDWKEQLKILLLNE